MKQAFKEYSFINFWMVQPFLQRTQPWIFSWKICLQHCIRLVYQCSFRLLVSWHLNIITKSHHSSEADVSKSNVNQYHVDLDQLQTKALCACIRQILWHLASSIILIRLLKTSDHQYITQSASILHLLRSGVVLCFSPQAGDSLHKSAQN